MSCRSRKGTCLLAVLAGVVWLNLPVLANEAAPIAGGDHPLIDITFGQIMLVVTNLGLGAVFLHFLLKKDARATKLEEIVKQQEATNAAQQATWKATLENMTEAFRQINERNIAAQAKELQAHRDLTREVRDAILMDVQGNTELKVMMKEILRHWAMPTRESAT